MANWFSTFVKRLVALPLGVWLLLGLMIVLGIAVAVMRKNQVKNGIIIAVVTAGIAAFVVIAALFGVPAELETADSIFYSPIFWGCVVAVLGLIGLYLVFSRKKFTVRMLSTGALSVALSFLLSCLILYRMPNGGSITPGSMVPILIYAYIYGPAAGMAAGTMLGALQLIQGATIVHPIQLLLDYILPFAMLGVAGFFKSKKLRPVGAIAAGFGRFCMHVISGAVFFASYAPEGVNPWLYSIGYNGSFMLPETIIAFVVICIPAISSMVDRMIAEKKPV